jgi:2,5-dioxopentanoate dehydrogenase
MLIPIGPVAVFGASNFPFAYSVAGGDTISALATKNPVVHKAHPAHIGTCELVGETIQDAVKECNLPEGVFSMLHGEESVGSQIVSHPTIKGVGFTGSIPGGRAIFDIASKRKVPIPVYAEMGSVNPVCVFPDYLKTKAKDFAKMLGDSFTASCGQFCTNPGIVFILGKEGKSEFYEALKTHLGTIPPHRMLTNGIKASFDKGFNSYSSIKGVTVFHKTESKGNDSGAVVLTTTAKVFIENSNILSHEVFGPMTILVECDSIEELKSCYSSTEGQLSSTLEITQNDVDSFDMSEIIDLLSYNAGRVLVNGVPTGLEIVSSIHHGGPYPASSDIRTGAVGPTALSRWVRPISYQNFGNFQNLLPKQLRDEIGEKVISIREENGIWKLKN